MENNPTTAEEFNKQREEYLKIAVEQAYSRGFIAGSCRLIETALKELKENEDES